jgi:SAM-dependent methyltransferase
VAFEELKQRQSVMWGNGPFVSIADTIVDLHEAVAESLAAGPGDDVHDVGCGTGGVAEIVAASGANVVGIDLAPGLIEIANQRAEERGLDIDYRIGDCENLDLPDASFDAVGSSVGIMFAPDHAATAAELTRVTKPGGRIALANWKPGPGVQDIFRVMSPFQPAPPPSSPFDWGDEARVRELLGDAFDLAFETRVNTVRYPTGDDYWNDMAENYGPTRTLATNLGDRVTDLRQAWIDEFGSGAVVHERPYLLISGRRR